MASMRNKVADETGFNITNEKLLDCYPKSSSSRSVNLLNGRLLNVFRSMMETAELKTKTSYNIVNHKIKSCKKFNGSKLYYS